MNGVADAGLPLRKLAVGASAIPQMTTEGVGKLSPVEMLGTWIVAQCLPRHEKHAASILAVAGVQFYLPLEERTDAGTKRKRYLPALPCYLPVCCRHDDDRYELVARYNTSGQPLIHGVIEVRDQAKFVKQLTGLHAMEMSGGIKTYLLPVVGQKCVISEKHPIRAIRGLEGTLLSAGDKPTFIVEIKMLGRAIAWEVASHLLEPIS